MRKHRIRHILHGLLDLLPLFVIPVFMVYSHRHVVDNYSVTLEGAYYQLEQSVFNGKPQYFTGAYPIEWTDFDNNDQTGYDSSSQSFYSQALDYISFDVNLSSSALLDSIYYVSFVSFAQNNDFAFSLYILDINNIESIVIEDILITTDITTYTYLFNYNLLNNSTFDKLNFTFYNDNSTGDSYFYLKNIQFFNLTDIFGSGNEPTAEQFSEMIGDTYYEYGQTYNVFLPYGTTTYNATDIGSQFVYSLYNATVNYFNTDSVFNLGSLHNWITNNFFNGNMPLGVTVVYHIIVYELIMDIIFLIYAVFMFIVDFASDFLEHCFTWSRRGGN